MSVLNDQKQHNNDNTSNTIVFISHSHFDKDVAEMLKEYLVATGVPNERIFCSSLPGNDVDSNISRDIKQKLGKSVVNIILLSRNYYDSVYCLNEEGVIWYLEDKAEIIVIGLPEINSEDMVGFINNNRILRRLDSDTDIAHINDIIQKTLGNQSTKASILIAETQKLKERYRQYLLKRERPEKGKNIVSVDVSKESPIELLSEVVLLYAAASDGTIIVDKTHAGASFVVGGKYNMNSSNEPREIAKWDAVIRCLEEEQLITLEKAQKTFQMYNVSYQGFSKAESFKELNHITICNNPQETIREFMEN